MQMRLVSNKTLTDFSAVLPAALEPLQVWRKMIESRPFSNFADIKTAFNEIDEAAGYYIFDIAGNKSRIIAAIHFDRQKLYIRNVLTNMECDKWEP